MPFPVYNHDEKDDYIRIGSTITLRHLKTDSFLHSLSRNYCKDGQQIVWCTNGRSFSRKRWLVVASTSNQLDVGSKVPYGAKLRLFHRETSKWLHSHNYKAHVTPDMYEVTGYGSANYTNKDDDWSVRRPYTGDKSGEFWHANDQIVLLQENRKAYLHCDTVKYEDQFEVNTDPKGEIGINHRFSASITD